MRHKKEQRKKKAEKDKKMTGKGQRNGWEKPKNC